MKKLFSIRSLILTGTLLLQLSALNFHAHGAAGDVDLSFESGSGVNGLVWHVVTQLDGKVLICGQFTSVNGTNRIRIARLNADGSLDSSFNPTAGTDWVVRFALQPDGNVIIGGSSTTVNGTNRIGLARLHADGSPDSNFNPEIPVGAIVSQYDYAATTAVALQPDGKVLVAGSEGHCYAYDDVGCSAMVTTNFLTRLNADGSRDTNFNSFQSAFQSIGAVGLQADSKILVGREGFRVARLNANGSLDGSFNSVIAGPDYGVYSITPLPDGKALIGGGFNVINGTNRNGIARLNANGSLDTSFDPGTGVMAADGAVVFSVAVQPDGKALIGGYFTAVNGVDRTNIARLNTDGSLDTSFNPGAGPDQAVRSIALQPDGNILIGGEFTTINGVLRPHVARLYGDSAAPSLIIARSDAFMIVSWPVTGMNFQLRETTNLSLANSWLPVAQPAVTNAGQISVTIPTTFGSKFFRLNSQ